MGQACSLSGMCVLPHSLISIAFARTPVEHSSTEHALNPFRLIRVSLVKVLNDFVVIKCRCKLSDKFDVSVDL